MNDAGWWLVLTIDPTAAESAIRACLQAEGIPAGHAADVAGALVLASLQGIDTHGVRLFGTYLNELKGGRAKREPVFTVHGDLPAMAVFDADDALGVVAGAEAMRLAIAKARRCGVGAVAVRNSNHFGRADYFARMAAEADQVGIVLSNSDALVIPVGGIAPLNGTNPLAMAAPGVGDDGFFLDMATSQTAYSRVLQAVRDNVSLAPGLASTLTGADASSGGEVATLHPLGGIKGQGLGTMIQIMCALLADMPFDADLSHLYCEPYDRPRKISHFMIAIEIGAFVGVGRFRDRVSSLMDRFRTTMPAGETPVLVPGDMERRSLAKRSLEGIPIDEKDYALLAPYL